MSTPLTRPQITPRNRPPHRRFLERLGPGLRSDQGLYGGEPESCRRQLREFLPIVAHLGLLVAVFQLFQVEGRGFLITTGVALAALPVHYLLPLRWKQPFLIAATMVGLGLTYGTATAAAIAVLGTLLVGICFVPVAWAARAGMVAAFALVAGLSRAGVLALGLPELVWPVLASFCMFRMIVLLYELKHAKKPEKAIDVLSYIFLLPNT